MNAPDSSATLSGFIHRFVPATGGATAPVALLLHGTGGTENDMLEVGRTITPGAALLSPRGKILENGQPRFFRRLAEGVFDEADLILRTHELADFVAFAATHHHFDPRNVIAIGYSNGANIAASLLLLRPETLRAAVLLRAMVPIVPEALPDLKGVGVFVAAGETDPLISQAGTEQLATMLREAGADVSLQWQPVGHKLTSPEMVSAREWITTFLAR